MNLTKSNDYSIEMKSDILKVAKATLKAEFVGIDEVIDEVINSISNWYLFPDLQERPVVINLWGMTGVGKTALIIRISELLDYESKLFTYDMGNRAERNTSLKEILSQLFLERKGMPAMIMLDEFQFANTKDEKDMETDNGFSRIIWDLLDSGKFQTYRQDSAVRNLIQNKEILEQALECGVKVENGIVTENLETYKEINSFNREDEFCFDFENYHLITNEGEKRYTFLPSHIFSPLYYIMAKKTSISDFKKSLMKLNGTETIQVFEKCIEIAQSNAWLDCTKCIIFVVGNLDEAYTMSSSFNPDLNANEFHEASKLININHIKQALRYRFRNEQIARLGNNHIIYPAFSEHSFYALINLELKNIADKYQNKFGIQLEFTDNFIQLIYDEGVFPTQGTRPLFSTIYQFVNAKFPELFSKNILKKLDADKIVFDYKNEVLSYEFNKSGAPVYVFEEKPNLNLSKLRRPSNDDLQALVSVHEAGHAIISIACLKVLPEYVCSTSSDIGSGGVTTVKRKWKYLSKEEILHHIALDFGGIIAEKIIFGPDKITRGSNEDIKKATELASFAIKDYGMGSILASLNSPDVYSKEYLHDMTGDYNSEVKALLEKGARLAETILVREKNLLIQLADHLSDERIIKKIQIEEKVREYGSAYLKNQKFIENGDHLFYRLKLKGQVFEAGNDALEKLLNENQMAISLNKNQE